MNNRALLLPDNPQGVFFINAFPRLTTANAIRGLCENELHTPFALYKVNRRKRFLDRIAEWGDLNRVNFSMLFINSHGGPGTLQLPDGNLYLSQIASALDGNAAGRWIHFSSCSTLNVDPSRIDEFMNETGAYGISGFTHDVEHFNSLSIEIQLLKELFYPVIPPPGGRGILRSKAKYWQTKRRNGLFLKEVVEY